MANQTELFTKSQSALETMKLVKDYVTGLLEAEVCGVVVVSIGTNIQTQLIENPQKTHINKDNVDEMLGPTVEYFQENKAIDFRSISITFTQSQSASISFSRTDFSTLIRLNEPARIPKQAFNILSDVFAIRPKSGLVLDALPEEQRNLFLAQQEAVASLTAETSKIGDFLLKMAEKQTDHIQDVTTQLTDQYNEKDRQLTEKIDEERKEVQADRKALDEREQKLNLRESRGVRRELLQKTEEAIENQNKFQFTSSTWSKSSLVHVLCLIGMAAGISLACVFLVPLFQGKYELATESVGKTEVVDTIAFSWFHFVPFPAGVILFGSTLVFYIRWASRWFSRHAESELSNLQYGKDMLRASWIAELLFEAADHKKDDKDNPVEFPPFLLEQMCANLFDYRPDSKASHPIDDIQKYAKKFKKFAIGAKGIEVETGDSEKKKKEES